MAKLIVCVTCLQEQDKETNELMSWFEYKIYSLWVHESCRGGNHDNDVTSHMFVTLV